MLRAKLSSTKRPRAFGVLGYSVSTSTSTSTVYPTPSGTQPRSHRHNPVILGGIGSLQAKDVVSSFKEWFKPPQNTLLMGRIFQILADRQAKEADADAALARLRLPLSERFVLDVLAHGERMIADEGDVFYCLRFFHWAGKQLGFHHTRATFHAIFKILSRAKRVSELLGLLQDHTKLPYVHRVRFYDTLVMGYAVAGKPEIALQLFAKMRFQGLDVDSFAYHVLLNALVEESCFDAFQVVVEQIRMKGYDNEITHSIIVKKFCKQGQLDEAKVHVEQLVENGKVGASVGHMVGLIVDSLCSRKRFEQAGRWLEAFRALGVVSLERAYGMWIRDLVRAGKVDGALEFLHSKKESERYVPDVCGYNILICRLLRENRLQEVFDLLVEMKEEQILPDKVTMNAVLCFFCKAGMVDVALELYRSREEFGLVPNCMVYNYLINTLCGDGSTDEAYQVLNYSLEQGYVPGKQTVSILADALCREGKLDKMKELILDALNRDIMPRSSTCGKSISALCNARRADDGYLILEKINKMNEVASKNSYFNIACGYNVLNRADIAARILIELQEKGHTPSRFLFRMVICGLFNMDNPEERFLKLLKMQLSHHVPTCQIYNFFIDGAGHAKKPELARKVFEMMEESGIVPNVNSEILVLQSYLKNERIFDALNFFTDLQKRRKLGRKLVNTMVVGLCKADKVDRALEILKEVKENGPTPSLQCYEELVKVLCTKGRYKVVVDLIDDLERDGRHVSSFIGNTLLFHALRTRELYETWVCTKDACNEISSLSLMLGDLIGEFSGRVGVNQDFNYLEKVIQRCFPLDVYTYNMLLMKLTRFDMDLALELFHRIRQKGYEPSRWTYDILVRGLFKHGRTSEANRWVEEMFQKGFQPTYTTKLLT